MYDCFNKITVLQSDTLTPPKAPYPLPNPGLCAANAAQADLTPSQANYITKLRHQDDLSRIDIAGQHGPDDNNMIALLQIWW